MDPPASTPLLEYLLLFKKGSMHSLLQLVSCIAESFQNLNWKLMIPGVVELLNFMVQIQTCILIQPIVNQNDGKRTNESERRGKTKQRRTNPT
jgi:hypothetical protein